MWTRDETGSVIDGEGKIIWFSQERFVRDIALGSCCLICGVSPDDAEFNDEHILPEWVLRRYNLFSSTITLPNGRTVRYGRYTVPCCKACNTLMGEKIEKPISVVVAAGREAVRQKLHEYTLPFFVWLGLIHLKTHLKDRTLRFHLDERKGSEKIADEYDWIHLHHLHAVVRSFYTGSTLAPDVIGSFIRLNMVPSKERTFDFADLYAAQTVMLRLDDWAFVTAFTDAGCAGRYFLPKLERLTGPLNPTQLREVMAEISSLNLHMKTNPKFMSLFDMDAEKHLIIVRSQNDEIEKWRPSIKGRLMLHFMEAKNAFPKFGRFTQKEALKLLRSGKLTFLFDDDGKFISQRRPRKATKAKRSKRVTTKKRRKS